MRTERYRDLLPVDRLNTAECTVIGVGAIGRQVALQLAAMGVRALQLIDFDTVETRNLGPQAYLEDDVGRPKVQATADLAQQLNHMLEVDEVNEKFARSSRTHPIVFCCVDSISTRRHIWSILQNRAELFIDGRMAAEIIRIVTVSGAASRQRYASTLFNEDQALRESCTARSTIYCANVAAGLMVSQFSQWLRGLPLEFDFMFNLLALELTTNPAPSAATSN